MPAREPEESVMPGRRRTFQCGAAGAAHAPASSVLVGVRAQDAQEFTMFTFIFPVLFAGWAFNHGWYTQRPWH
jgi:hypothetical protein